MKLVAIDVGHTPKSIDGGAINSELDVCEFDFNNELSHFLACNLREFGVRPIVVYRESYAMLPDHINQTNADLCVSLHCNAYDTQTKGAEVLYHANSAEGKSLAKSIQYQIVNQMAWHDRGVKPISGDDRGGALLEKTKMPSVIIEPFFIDHTESLLFAIENQQQLASVIAQGIDEHPRSNR